MSVKVEASAGGVPHNTVMIIGAVIALVSLYIGIAGNYLLGVDWFAVFGGIAVIGALVWGNSTIKKLCSYGIGTGVPSAGMLAFGAGTAAFIAASAIFCGFAFGIWLVPVLTLVLALILGLIFGWIANSVENMKIPVMTRSIAELSAVGAIALAGFALLATGGVDLLSISSAGFLGLDVGSSFLGAGIIAVGFMLGALALQHPFNACLGPGEKQDRTNMLALECGFLSMIVMAVISFVFVSPLAGWISLIVAVIGWVITYAKYVALSKRDAAAWLDAKPFEDKEE
ncbi:MAG: tetrahydromethanopterin S-methyltransferase subunit C [Methanocorpusculum sp.]|nr:tetrahydromethanopterin S-methyltransferase subunit C [Methanocorpusculum sp.]HJJ44691.1 tetrahydromethanopterin S-methyltransferase subunit C [Methanocorpusculum sp.]